MFQKKEDGARDRIPTYQELDKHMQQELSKEQLDEKVEETKRAFKQ